ncbi:DJ-1/PfpI family protein [Pseudonocardia sp. TMWB2A]|uniref:DJ-1/PfpI family protein n=1 Tax=Pseudonocardia sp. TMWB2A TaxID=687430 RepID=UPI00307DE220
MSTRTPFRVTVLVYPGIDELDLFGVHSVLAKATPRLEVRIASQLAEVRSSGGVTFTVPHRLDEVRRAHALVVPGGRGARDASADGELVEAVRDAARGAALLYAVCTGVLVIAAAGLARGRRVAIHRGKTDLLHGYEVGAVAAGLIRDGPLRTVGGIRRESVKAVDLAFSVLQDFVPDLVEPIADRIETDPGDGRGDPRR